MKGRRQPTVMLPSEVVANRSIGTLYGIGHDESATVNVISCGEPPRLASISPKCVALGQLVESSFEPDPDGLCGWYGRDGPEFFLKGLRCRVETYSLVLDLFSRNAGIIETGALLDATAVLAGCGSVGSLVALELARAGVGRFLLIDNDVLAYHNICRHQCGISDVGRFKVEAVKDRILDINPDAHVESTTEIIETVPKDVFDNCCRSRCVIVGCADNREGDLYANKISCLYGVPFVSIGFWERAFAGELFWSIPGKTPCYYCAFGTASADSAALSHRTSTNRRVYTNEEDLLKTKFEPGISMDISFVTIVGTKLALDLLYAEPSRKARTKESLTQFTLICNTPDDEVGGDLAGIFSYALQITRSIEIERLEACPHCALVTRVDAATP